MKKGKCLSCGKEFLQRRKARKYCSEKCYFKVYYRKRNPLEKKVCPLCERKFKPKKSNNQECCSELCSYTLKLLRMKRRRSRI